jgi:GH43 family beta-xylosidase
MYGTRAINFGVKAGGFDVYTSTDLINWSEPEECFNSDNNGFNCGVNWAPEVHKYRNAYYMFATFTKPNGFRGTYILKSDNPKGPFKLHSKGAVTPYEWECLDGTLYIDKKSVPYLVFCHEHTQIINGTVCYIQLSDDLKTSIGEPVTLFSGSSPYWADKKPDGEHYITDGPFMFRTKDDNLLMIWSTFIGHSYIEALVRFKDGEINENFEHLDPIITDDGGHGMIFEADEKLYLTFHSPNQTGYERVKLIEIEDKGNEICAK